MVVLIATVMLLCTDSSQYVARNRLLAFYRLLMSRFQIVPGALLYTNPDTGVTISKGVILPQQLPVAIKTQLSMNVSDANNIIREAVAMSGLQHEGICQIYDCYMESTEWGQFKAIVVVEGMESDLWEELIRRRNFGNFYTDEQLMGVLRALVSALSYAEERGVCHRDIKPQNVFLRGAAFKMGDFGSASKHFDMRYLSQSIRGSPYFLSPELKRSFVMQGMGNVVAPYDPVRSDVYSLGLTVLCMALLEPPESLSNLEGLEAATSMCLAKLTQYPQTHTVLARMLQVDPKNRPTFRELDAQFNALAPPVNPAFSQAMLGSIRPPASGAWNPQQVCIVCRGPFVPKPQFFDSPFCSSGCYEQSKIPTVCSICTQPISDKTWMRSMPSNLRPFEAFADSVCSSKCLEKYRDFSGSQMPGFVQPLFNQVKEEVHDLAERKLPQAAPWVDMAADYIGSYLQNK